MTDLLAMPRRLSSVLVCHAQCEASSMNDLLIRMARVKLSEQGQIGSWMSWRMLFGASRSYLPQDPSYGEVDGLYWHDIVILVPPKTLFASLPCSVALLVAPYVRLLGAVTEALAEQMGHPGMRFLGVDMKEVFSVSRQLPMVSGDVVEISFDYFGDAQADRFSLKGRNPIRSVLVEDLFFSKPGVSPGSDLTKQPELTYQPHGIVVRAKKTGYSTNVRSDRFGNMWWYSRDLSALNNVVPVIEELASFDALFPTLASPMRRVRWNPDEEEAE